ncbi:Triosephosphate isomerase-like protein [Chaetomium strumarium]|uniref:Triosephosphate isomerase n=1 Tax=Chaetomium strumarium TaxID=1170767 RepID=A0AAJ0M2P0_9PEZI|nr:Triosephosphate isomerase-like protein [Chaetomium strumarium]
MPTRPSSGHRPLIGVSTKMYFTHARTNTFITAVLSHHLLLTSDILASIDAFIIPDFVSLTSAIAAISAISSISSTITSHSHSHSNTTTITTTNNTLLVGAQDCSPSTHDFGPYTGEVSPAVLKEIGCRIVEVGHAERRRLFGETDDVVRDKVAAAVRNGLWPLICVGEEQRHIGELGSGKKGAVEVAAAEVLRQVAAALRGVEDENAEVILAYEPVWAIGAPEPASAEHVRGVVRRVRESEVVRGRKGRTRIVYGGAAGPGLWEKLEGEVDGLFLGRFAHEPEQFVKLIHEVAGLSVDRSTVKG